MYEGMNVGMWCGLSDASMRYAIFGAAATMATCACLCVRGVHAQSEWLARAVGLCGCAFRGFRRVRAYVN